MDPFYKDDNTPRTLRPSKFLFFMLMCIYSNFNNTFYSLLK